MAEHVQRVGSRREHRLSTAADDDEWTAGDRLVDDVARDLYDLRISGRPVAVATDSADPILGAKSHRLDKAFHKRRHSLFTRSDFVARYTKPRRDSINYSVVEKGPSERLSDARGYL